MTMITPSYLGETIEYSSLHACRSTLEDPTPLFSRRCKQYRFWLLWQSPDHWHHGLPHQKQRHQRERLHRLGSSRPKTRSQPYL